MPLNIVINGALGRMGKEIADIVLNDEALKLYGCVEYPGHVQVGDDYGLASGKGKLDILVRESFDNLDLSDAVVIDFSSPDSTRSLLEKAVQRPIRVVAGTTGLSDAEISLARKAAQVSPILVSPNMSLGVNLLFLLTEMVTARLKDDFDIEIIEAHHRFKKDAPSGTARRLGEIVASELEQPYDKAVRNGRSGIFSSIRSTQEIGMHAVRAGDIVGDHTVLFGGIGERLELRHMAHSRSTFARGAVTAAKWLAQKEPGLYSMRDVLAL